MSAHFFPLKVAEIVPETAEANSIRFEVPPELRERFRFKAGQHLTLKATIDGEEVRRNYSLCTAPADQDWMVTVKRIANGIFSNWVGDNLKAGDTIDVMPPHGSFTTEFSPGAKRHIVGIAGGSGITPVLSLLKTTLKEEPESEFTLFYGNRDSSSIIFLDELANLKDRYLGRLSLHHFLAEEEGDIDLFNGMLDRERCHLAVESLIGDARSVDAWFICGPGPMMDAAEATLVERGVRRRSPRRSRSYRRRRPARRCPSPSTDGRGACHSRNATSLTALGPRACRRHLRARRASARPAGRRSPAARSRWRPATG
jgi:ring-1,2-phenylacetyl-CoA epoxidase subunit PaaE